MTNDNDKKKTLFCHCKIVDGLFTEQKRKRKAKFIDSCKHIMNDLEKENISPHFDENDSDIFEELSSIIPK